jgi:hypothetical protein
MEKATLERLLNTACEFIIELEVHANESLKKDIEVFFNEIKYSDEIGYEMNLSADEEAQDWNTFYNNKI